MTINFNFNIGVNFPINRQPKSSHSDTQQSNHSNTQQSSESEEQRFKQALAEKRAISAKMHQRDLDAMMKEMIRSKK